MKFEVETTNRAIWSRVELLPRVTYLRSRLTASAVEFAWIIVVVRIKWSRTNLKGIMEADKDCKYCKGYASVCYKWDDDHLSTRPCICTGYEPDKDMIEILTFNGGFESLTKQHES